MVNFIFFFYLFSIFLTLISAFTVNYSTAPCQQIITQKATYALDENGNSLTIPSYAQTFISCSGINSLYSFAEPPLEAKQWILYYGLSAGVNMTLDNNITFDKNPIGSRITYYTHLLTTVPSKVLFQTIPGARFALPQVFVLRQVGSSNDQTSSIVGTVFLSIIILLVLFMYRFF